MKKGEETADGKDENKTKTRKRLIGLAKMNILSLGNKKNSLKRQISDWRKSVNRHLDSLQIKLSTDVDQLHKTVTSSLLSNVSKLSKNKITVEEFTKEMEGLAISLQANGNCESLPKVEEGETVIELDYNMTIQTPFSNVVQHIPNLGSVSATVTSKPMNDKEVIPTSSTKISDRLDISADLVKVSHIRELRVEDHMKKPSFGVHREGRKEALDGSVTTNNNVLPPTYDIGGATIGEDNTILLTDRSRKTLMFCEMDGAIVKELDLPYRPSTVTVMNRENVAISFPDCQSKSKVPGGPAVWKSKVGIMNISDAKIVKELDFPGKCWSVAPLLDRFLIAACLTEICVVDIDTNAMSHRLIFPKGCIRHICTDDASRVYYTDWNENALYCIELDKKSLVYCYKSQHLRGPTTVAMDMDNRCYVVGLVSSNVHQVDQSGNLMKIVLNQDNGLHEPHILSFKPFSEMFILTENDEKQKNDFKIFEISEHFSSTCI